MRRNEYILRGGYSSLSELVGVRETDPVKQSRYDYNKRQVRKPLSVQLREERERLFGEKAKERAERDMRKDAGQRLREERALAAELEANAKEAKRLRKNAYLKAWRKANPKKLRGQRQRRHDKQFQQYLASNTPTKDTTNASEERVQQS
jgi:hypothetical protein